MTSGDASPDIRVVVVEDQPDIAAALRELVEADGTAAVVAVCHTLAIGTEMVQRFRPELVLTDFRLPDGDAVECFGSWLAASPGVRIVVASAWTDDRSVRRAMAAGASGYVEKGQGLMELSTVIARVCAGEHVWQASPPTGSVPVIRAGSARPAERRAAGHGMDGDGRHGRGRRVVAAAPSPGSDRPRSAAAAAHAGATGATGGTSHVAARSGAVTAPDARVRDTTTDPPASAERTGSARRHGIPAAASGPLAEVLRGVLASRSTDEIAADLGITVTEVRQHVNVLLRAAGVRTRAALRGHHGVPT